MNGQYQVRVSNAKVRFDFELHRNITVVRGNSGTGKTTLYEMVAEHMRLGEQSGVNISCDVPCVALSDMDWANQLKKTKSSIVFIDEGADYTSSIEFANEIRNTDNYYVIFIRENLYLLPYSVNEIYEIKTSGKYHRFIPMYKEKAGHVYGVSGKWRKTKNGKLLTEDSNAGFQFYDAYFNGTDIEVEAAKGNTSVYNWLSQQKEGKVIVIADGAAFGSEMDRVMKLQKIHPDRIRICLPESFEWMILKSGLIKADDIKEVMEKTSEYVDSEKYFSWEQFFTDYLVQNTKNTPFEYTKKKINKVYLIHHNTELILAAISLGV